MSKCKVQQMQRGGHNGDNSPGVNNTPGRPSLLEGRVSLDGKFFQRGGQRFRVQGVTYGPFAPNLEGEPFPTLSHVRTDFALMQEIGINSIRTYHLPPDWFLQQADEQGMAVFV